MVDSRNEPEKDEMPNSNGDHVDHLHALEEWHKSRKEIGLNIDPNDAEVTWLYAQTLDPYGIIQNIPDAMSQVGREYFARSSDSENWVWFGDLPEKTRKIFWMKHRSNLAFPAGLSDQPRNQ
jgi:hypothetical protein